MLRKEAVEAGTLDLIKKMMADNRFQDFNLVGGTALALMIGHRKSIDIDLFSTKDFNSHEIAEYLTSTYNAISVHLEPIDYIGPDVKWSDITEKLKNAHANPHLNFGLPDSD